MKPTREQIMKFTGWLRPTEDNLYSFPRSLVMRQLRDRDDVHFQAFLVRPSPNTIIAMSEHDSENDYFTIELHWYVGEDEARLGDMSVWRGGERIEKVSAHAV